MKLKKRNGLSVLAWAGLVAAALLIVALAGCRHGREVVVPARETAENWQTDTITVVPAPLAGEGTGRLAAPARVERLDRSRANAPAPFDVSEIALGGDTLTVHSPRETRHFGVPARGETLRVRREAPARGERAGGRADSASNTGGRVTGRVDGRPMPDTVRAAQEAEEEAPSIGEKVASLPAWVIALLLGALAAVLIFFFRIFR